MLCTWRYNGGGQTVMYENNARHEEGWGGEGVRAFEFHKLARGGMERAGEGVGSRGQISKSPLPLPPTIY